MSTGSRPGVTAVVLTLDEERHLPDCLASLAFADEVVVLDSGSRDATVDLARTSGARVETHPFVNYSRQRQHALSLTRTTWILFVDADERVPGALAAEVRRATARSEPAGFWVPRQNVFWGHTMRGGGWWPDEQLRLLRVDRTRYDPDRAVHEVARVAGAVGHLHEPLVHLNYDSPTEFRRKQLAYARLEVERRLAAGERVRAHHLVLQPLRAVRRRYLDLGGWRDGATGAAVCLWMGWVELATLRQLAAASRQADAGGRSPG